MNELQRRGLGAAIGSAALLGAALVFQYVGGLGVCLALDGDQGQRQSLLGWQRVQSGGDGLQFPLAGGRLLCGNPVVIVVHCQLRVSLAHVPGANLVYPGILADPVGPFGNMGICGHALFQNALHCCL